MTFQDFLGRIDFKMSELVTESEGKVVLPLLDKDDTPMQSGSVEIWLSCTFTSVILDNDFLRGTKQSIRRSEA